MKITAEKRLANKNRQLISLQIVHSDKNKIHQLFEVIFILYNYVDNVVFSSTLFFTEYLFSWRLRLVRN